MDVETPSIHEEDVMAEAAAGLMTMGAPRPSTKRKPSSLEPIRNEDQLKALREEKGLTQHGEAKLKGGDRRCRPPGVFQKLFTPSLPEFRLPTILGTAHAEDLVMLWASLHKKDMDPKSSKFRFDKSTYTSDTQLLIDLQQIGSKDGALVAYIKRKYGTVRSPKRQRVQNSEYLEDDILFNNGTTNDNGTTNNTMEEDPLLTEVRQIRREANTFFEHRQTDRIFTKPIDYDSLVGTNKGLYLCESAQGYIDLLRMKLLQRVLLAICKQKKPEYSSSDHTLLLRAFHKACWDGQSESLLRELLELMKHAMGASNTIVNAVIPGVHFNTTALHQAVLGRGAAQTTRSQHFTRDNFATAKHLLEMGAAVDARDWAERTPLHYATIRNDLLMMRLLLSYKADANASAKDGISSLHIAAQRGDMDSITLLLKYGAKEDKSKAEESTYGTALHSAAGAMAVSSIADFEDTRSTRKKEKEEKRAQLERRQFIVCEYLLNNHFSPNAHAWDKTTPLHKAAEAGNKSVMTLLLGLDVDCNATDLHKRTPLHLAASNRHHGCIRLLLQKKALSKTKDINGWSPLMRAVASGDKQSVLNLIPTSDVRDKNYLEDTALHIAAACGHAVLVEELFNAKADVNATNARGHTPLMVAVRGKNLSCVTKILSLKPDINLRDDDGYAALMMATEMSNFSSVEKLLQAGARVDFRGTDGKTCLDIAKENKDDNIVEILRKFGAIDSPPLTTTELTCLRWDEMLHQLVTFHEEKKRLPAPGERKLGKWLQIQLEKLRWDLLEENEIKGLSEKLPHPLKGWGIGLLWTDALAILKKFISQHGRLPEPWVVWSNTTRGSAIRIRTSGDGGNDNNDDDDDVDDADSSIAVGTCDIGLWCNLQRCRKERLQAGERQQLEMLPGWSWSLNGAGTDRSHVQYLEHLKTFCKRERRFPHPTEEEKLCLKEPFPVGQWYRAVMKIDAASELMESVKKEVDRIKQSLPPFVPAKFPRPKYKNPVPAPGDNDYNEYMCDELKQYVQEHNKLPSKEQNGNISSLGKWLEQVKFAQRQNLLDRQLKARIETALGQEFAAQLWSSKSTDDSLPSPMQARTKTPLLKKTEAGIKPLNPKAEEVATSEIFTVDHRSVPPQNIPEKHLDAYLAGLFEKAHNGAALKPSNVVDLLNAWKENAWGLDQMPHNKKPVVGNLFVVAKDSPYKQDGHIYDTNTHSTLKVDGMPRLKCYYSTCLKPGLQIQRKAYHDINGNTDLVLLHYTKPSRAGRDVEAPKALMMSGINLHNLTSSQNIGGGDELFDMTFPNFDIGANFKAQGAVTPSADGLPHNLFKPVMFPLPDVVKFDSLSSEQNVWRKDAPLPYHQASQDAPLPYHQASQDALLLPHGANLGSIAVKPDESKPISIDVIEKLRQAEGGDRLSMESALRMLFDEGIGGSAMQWLAIKIGFDMTMSDETAKRCFQVVQKYVLEGKIKAAVDYVQQMEKYMK